MLFVRAALSFVLSATLALSAAHASRFHHSPTRGHGRSAMSRKQAAPRKSRLKGQRQIDSDRAREIQQALIEQNYLSGEPSGQWNAETQAAMKRYQSDHGWQTKIMPDSRALIKLGLGPVQADSSAAVQAAKAPAAKSEAPRPTSGVVDDSNTLAATRSTGR